VDPEGLARYVLSTYPDLVRSAVIQSFEPARVRLVFSDGTYMDIRYNERGRYSYHWQRGKGQNTGSTMLRTIGRSLLTPITCTIAAAMFYLLT